MDGSCFGANCKDLKMQTFDEANKCVIPKTVDESVDGCKSTRCVILMYWPCTYSSRAPDRPGYDKYVTRENSRRRGLTYVID